MAAAVEYFFDDGDGGRVGLENRKYFDVNNNNGLLFIVHPFA
jgi:hypothetical protein